MAVIAFPMGIFGKRLLLAGKGALKKKKPKSKPSTLRPPYAPQTGVSSFVLGVQRHDPKRLPTPIRTDPAP